MSWTFEEALEKTKDVTGLIVYSDQGIQYTSYVCHDMLQKVGAHISMLGEAVAMTMPRWRASSRISKRNGGLVVLILVDPELPLDDQLCFRLKV